MTVRMRCAAAIWLVGALGYFLAEYLAARAFLPSYSVAYNFISDLGVPECGDVFQGRSICSPRHGLMNAFFCLQGASFLAGAVLARPDNGSKSSTQFLSAAGLYCLGMICIALFHGASAAEANGTFPLHVGGALVSIISGNATMLLARTVFGGALSAVYKRACTVLAAISLIAFVTLALLQAMSTTFLFGPGIWERSILYAILLWQIMTASLILSRSDRG